MEFMFERSTNPLTQEGMKALGIVLAVIVVISGAVYSYQLAKRGRSTVSPAKIEVELTPQPTAAVTPTAIQTITPTATQSTIPTEAPVEFFPEVPVATTSPTIGVIISPIEVYPSP